MEYREELRSIGERILSETRTELYLAMHFLGPALGSLSPVMGRRTVQDHKHKVKEYRQDCMKF